MSDEAESQRRKGDRRSGDRRITESPTAKLAAAPTDQGFSIDQPYAQRRLIVVVPSEVVAVEPSAAEGAKRKASAKDRADALIGALEQTAGADAALSPGVVHAIRGVMELRDAGLEVRMVAAIDAAKQLSLPPGHPFHGVIYVGHPGVPEIYYPAGEFHLRVFEHKFNEAVDLVMALGASKITVVREEGLEPKETKGLALALVEAVDSTAVFEASFPGSNEPLMPKRMVWWKSERSWQTLARARTRHRTRGFSLTVRYETDYGVNEALRQQVEAVGLNIGGRFHPQVNTVWKLNVEFPAPTAGAPSARQPVDEPDDDTADESDAPEPEPTAFEGEGGS